MGWEDEIEKRVGRMRLREIIDRSLGVFKLLTAAQFKAVLASPHLNTRYEEQVQRT